MQLSAVILARAFYFIETRDLNPRGMVDYRDIVRALVDRFGFEKYPQKPEDFDESKGVTFEAGRLTNQVVDRLIVYTNSIFLDTRSSTSDSEAVLEETLMWASKELGLTYDPRMVKRRGYVSQLTFHSDVPLIALNQDVLAPIAKRVSDFASEKLQQIFEFSPSSIVLNFDRLLTGLPIAAFGIERRNDTPFAENKYFSVAPVSTDLHIELLQQFEKALIAGSPHLKSGV